MRAYFRANFKFTRVLMVNTLTLTHKGYKLRNVMTAKRDEIQQPEVGTQRLSERRASLASLRLSQVAART